MTEFAKQITHYQLPITQTLHPFKNFSHFLKHSAHFSAPVLKPGKQKFSPHFRMTTLSAVSKIHVIEADKMKLFLLSSNLELPERRRFTLLLSDKYETFLSI